MKRWTDEERLIAFDMWINYVPMEQIAAALGRSLGVTRQMVYLSGWPVRDQYATFQLREAPPEIKAVLFREGADAFRRRMRLYRGALSEGQRAYQAALKQQTQVTAIGTLHSALATGDDRNDAIRASRAAGATLQKIADEFGITRERVRQICDADRPFRVKRGTTFDYAAIAEAYRAGSTVTAIAAEFGCSAQTVIRALKHTATPRRNGKSYDHERLATIYADSANAEEAAVRLGCCPATVRNAARAAGVLRRRGRPTNHELTAREYEAAWFKQGEILQAREAAQ